MEVICLQSEAFYNLVENVVDRLMEQRKEKPKWISGDEAMELLKVTSRTTLHKIKNEGHVKFTQPMKKVILYERKSLLEYLEKHSQEPF